MNFIESFKTCFKKYAVFKGRATRSEFWWFQLFVFGITIAAPILDTLLLGYNWLEDVVTPLAMVVTVATLIPSAAVIARRLHDIGWSGWWQLPMYASYVTYLEVFSPGVSETILVGSVIALSMLSSLVLLAFFIKDSQPRTNKYGPNPKSPEMGEVFS